MDKTRRREISRASYHRRKRPPELSDHLCECGCGSFTFLAHRTSAEKGWVKGEPKRFVHGHNQRKFRDVPPEMRCSRCRATKNADQFYRDKHRSSGLSSECRDCRKTRVLAWYEKNAERHQEAHKKWLTAHPEEYKRTHLEGGRRRRARLAEVAYEKVDPWFIYERDGGKCHICGKHVAKKNMSLDHLIPISKGGDHLALNIRLAHLQCNIKRGAGRLPAQLLLT